MPGSIRVAILSVMVALLAAGTTVSSAARPRDGTAREAALKSRVDGLYRAWAAGDWRADLRFMTPDVQRCEDAQDIEMELVDDSGEWPVAWQGGKGEV